MSFVVEPGVSEEKMAALRVALARSGIDLDSRSPLYDSAWRHAGLREGAGFDGPDGRLVHDRGHVPEAESPT